MISAEVVVHLFCRTIDTTADDDSSDNPVEFTL